ncbi:MAG: hypothetical protein U1F33_02350 [Alphaproteobacteria bacterium]
MRSAGSGVGFASAGVGFVSADDAASALGGRMSVGIGGTPDGALARPGFVAPLESACDFRDGGVLGVGLSTAAGGGGVGIGSAAALLVAGGAALECCGGAAVSCGSSIASRATFVFRDFERVGGAALSGASSPVSSATPVFRDVERGGVKTIGPPLSGAGSISGGASRV